MRVKSPKFSPAAREKNEDFRAIYKGKMGVKSAAGEFFKAFFKPSGKCEDQ